MSQQERDWLTCLAAYERGEGGLTQGGIAALLGCDVRTVSRRLRRYRAGGDAGLVRLDETNREHMARYAANVYAMEQLTRVKTNLGLLRMHQAQNEAAGWRPVEVEIVGLRVGDFVLVTFPGELSAQIGLDLKRESPHELTFVAGYTNGYIYYAPTAEQLRNRGGAQEDSDCVLAPEWEGLFREAALAVLRRL